MAEQQLTFKENEISHLLNKVYLHFKNGQFKDAIGLLEQALAIDFDYPEVGVALKCANFWLERKERFDPIPSLFEKGEYLLGQWKVFSGFIQRIGAIGERCLSSLKGHVFGTALECFQSLEGGEESSDAELLLRKARCLKALGNFEAALASLEEAGQQRREDAAILADLADCYALVNESRAAKVFFRESFFLDPQAVELAFLESPLIQRLIARLRQSGYPENVLKEWIPVYGTLYSLFNIKRELRPVELGKLKQSIYQLERELERESSAVMVPRLINRYLWLIDHYLSVAEDRGKIDELLDKIKRLDPIIYREYLK